MQRLSKYDVTKMKTLQPDVTQSVIEGLSKIAAAVQAEMRKMGLHNAVCRGHFHPGIHLPDQKVILVSLGKHRNAALVKDCFDMKVVDYIAKRFVEAYNEDPAT